MTNISKVSDITTNDLAEYLRLISPTQGDLAELGTYKTIAVKFISDYTGLTTTEIDRKYDLVIVVFVLVQDMYDNRTLYVDKTNLNKVVESTLGMHSQNLLPREEEE